MPDIEPDPLSIIAARPPQLSSATAIELVSQHYGLDVECRSLVSERDQNFHLITPDRRQFVLKIANAAEDPQVTHFQIEAFLHLQRAIVDREIPIQVPEILMTLDGRSHLLVAANGDAHVTRVVSYLPGVPLSTVPKGAQLSNNLGVALAWLGKGLSDFEHAGADQSLLWDMKQALQLRDLLQHIQDPAVRKRVEDCLNDFEVRAMPVLAGARTQIIHNDAHGDNLLVVADSPDAIAGVIDFGDMLRSPLIIDLGVAAAYLRSDDDDPLSLIVPFVSGYDSVTPLLPSETDILYYLIRARLAATIAIHYWRVLARTADDAYLRMFADSGADADAYLQALNAISTERAAERLRTACETTTA